MISLYGSLARAFRKKYKTDPKNIPICAKSGRDVVQALDANFRGFRALIKRSGEYKFTRGNALFGGTDVSEREIEIGFGEDWHLMPVAAGCKKGGLLQTIAGVVLIVVGAVISYASSGTLASIGGGMIKVGAALAIGGVAQMLFTSPTSDYASRESADERPSYLFDGPVNTSGAGAALPLAFGKTWIGTHTVSAGMTVENV